MKTKSIEKKNNLHIEEVIEFELVWTELSDMGMSKNKPAKTTQQREKNQNHEFYFIDKTNIHINIHIT